MRRFIILALLYLAIAGSSPASGASLVLLGTNQPATLTAFPALHTLKAFEGRIFMGYGDWNQYPAAVVTSYQPGDGTFHLEFSAYTDSIGLFREVGGKLYVPSIDPVHFQDFHDLSYRSGGVWRDHSPVGMYHVFDVATVTGNDLWIVGSKSVNDTTNDNAAVFRSLDGGRTWEDKTIQSTQFRYYWGFTLRGKFYVYDTVYTNGVGRSYYSLYNQLYKPTPIGEGNSEFVVGLAGRTPGILHVAPFNLVTFDTVGWRTAWRTAVLDFTVHGSNLFTLETGFTSTNRQIWRASSLNATQAVWQSLEFANVPTTALCVEVMDGIVYVGDAQGRLWAGRLDGETHVVPPSTVVNELSDDFGKGLSIDGNVMAVGAPDHSGGSLLSGQVSIWENQTEPQGGSQWIRQAVIDPPSPSFSGWFGKEVALKGDILAVAETGRDIARNDRGRSSLWHLYQRTDVGWERRQTNAQPYIHSIAMDGDALVVGTSTQLLFYRLVRNSSNVVSAASAGGITFSSVPSSIYEPSVRVAMESNLIVAALSGDVSRYGGPGEVRVYAPSPLGPHMLTNLLQQPWTAPPRGAPFKPDRFGFAIALKNGWLAVGAPRDDTAAMQSGAVYLYQRIRLTNGAMSFVPRQIIYCPSRQVEAAFGSSLALTDSRLIVGSSGTEMNGVRHRGTAHVYQLVETNWVSVGQIHPPVNSAGEFGSRIAAGSNWVAVASRFSETSTNLEARVALLPHLAPYDLWTTFHGLQGIDALESANADGDEADNLVEFASNLNPRLSDAEPVSPNSPNKGLPAARMVRLNDVPYLQVTLIRSRYPDALGLTYILQTSEDLMNWTTAGDAPIEVVPIDPEWEQAIYRFPMASPDGSYFCRLRVGKP